jgi:hypothetical protein
MDDVYAIDTIQACGAKVSWITPENAGRVAAQALVPTKASEVIEDVDA